MLTESYGLLPKGPNISRPVADPYPSSSNGGHGRRHFATSSPLRNIPRRASRSNAQHRSSPGRNNRGGNATTTFLTDASFGVARDRIVEALTSVHPYEPHWEDLTSVDLSNKAIDSVATMKEFLPNLNALYL
jgi:protein NUD1